MRRSVATALAATLAFSTIAAGEATDHEPVLNNERVYLHCGDVTVTNVEGGTPFGWDTEAPTQSVQEGAGCGTLDPVMSEGEVFEFGGVHTGNLDELTLELYMMDAGIVRVSDMTGGVTADVPEVGAFTEIYADVEILVSGAEDSFAGFVGEARFPVEYTNDGATAKMTMTITGMDMLLAQDAGEHTVTVKISTADYYNGDSGAWVLDTTEVPTGITFNPTEEQRSSYVVESF